MDGWSRDCSAEPLATHGFQQVCADPGSCRGLVSEVHTMMMAKGWGRKWVTYDKSCATAGTQPGSGGAT